MPVVEYILLAVGFVWGLNFFIKQWRKADLEAKRNEIERIEKESLTVAELKAKYPDFDKKKAEVEKFLNKK